MSLFFLPGTGRAFQRGRVWLRRVLLYGCRLYNAGKMPARPEEGLEPLQNFCAFVLVLRIGQIASVMQTFNLIQTFFGRDVLHRKS